MKSIQPGKVIIIMAIALVGLVLIQLYWINTAVKLQKQQFHQNVYSALNVVSKKLEDREIYGYIEKEVNIDTDKNFNKWRRVAASQPDQNKAVLGVELYDIDSELALANDLKSNYGVFVRSVERGSPAYYAGIRKGDIITEIDEATVNNIADVKKLMTEYKRGDIIKLKYERLDPHQKQWHSSCHTFDDYHFTNRPDNHYLFNYISNHSHGPIHIATEFEANVSDSIIEIAIQSGFNKPKIEKETWESASDFLRKLQNGSPDSKLDKYDSQLMLQRLQEIQSQSFYQTLTQVSEIMDQLYNRPERLRDRICKFDVDSIIATTMREYGIRECPSWRILDHHGDVVMSCNNNEPFNEIQYETAIFENIASQDAGFIHLNFPGQTRSYLSALTTTSLPITAFLLIGVIVGCFVYALKNFLQQKKISELKTDFINNMTHELKTPVSTIRSASEMIQDKGVPLNERSLGRYMGIIQEENNRLSTQIERVLQFAKIDKGNIKLNIEDLNIHQVLEAVIKNTSLLIEQKEGQLEKQFLAPNPVIKADKVHLTNIFNNLLDNAVKYTNRLPLIQIATKETDDAFVVSFKDNGIGMSKEVQAKIFEKFYREPKGNLHDVKGFGLGLSYVKLLTEAHGGRVEVSSKPSRGSLFELFFPKPALQMQYA